MRSLLPNVCGKVMGKSLECWWLEEKETKCEIICGGEQKREFSWVT